MPQVRLLQVYYENLSTTINDWKTPLIRLILLSGNPKDYGNSPILDTTFHTPLNHYGVFKIANEGTARVFW
jgi:hypothetical protein